jgi:threonine synthase
MYTAGKEAPEAIGENGTLAEGVKVRNPLRKDAVLSAINDSGGSISIVEEHEILTGRNALARLGFYVEPTSAIVWSALARMVEILPEPVVVILTGSGLKYE